MTQFDDDNNSGNRPEQPPESNSEFGKIGRTMFFMAGGLLLLMFMFNKLQDRQYNPNTSPVSSYNDLGGPTVTLERNRYGHYVSSGFVNGQEVTFMLDTGATRVAIPGALEKRLRVKRGLSHQVHTANGTATAYQTHIEQLKIGEITLYNVNATIAPSMEGEEILLGMSVLKRLDFEQRGNRLTLTQ